MRPRENPFASHRVEGLRFRFAGIDWPGLLARLDELGGRGAIVGPHGSGKTTLLEELADRLYGRGLRVRLLRREGWGPERDPGGPISSGDAVLVDGGDRLGGVPWGLLRLRARRATVVVLTTHREGRLPTLYHCSTSPTLFAELLGELTGRAPEYHSLLADELHRRHRGDLRSALRELYDRAASTPTWLS